MDWPLLDLKPAYSISCPFACSRVQSYTNKHRSVDCINLTFAGSFNLCEVLTRYESQLDRKSASKNQTSDLLHYLNTKHQTDVKRNQPYQLSKYSWKGHEMMVFNEYE